MVERGFLYHFCSPNQLVVMEITCLTEFCHRILSPNGIEWSIYYSNTGLKSCSVNIALISSCYGVELLTNLCHILDITFIDFNTVSATTIYLPLSSCKDPIHIVFGTLIIFVRSWIDGIESSQQRIDHEL